MEYSRRIGGIVTGKDDGWSVHYRAKAMEAAGEEVVLLSVGEHDIKTDPAIRAAMKAGIDAGNLGYSAVMGSDALRDAIAARVTANNDVPASRENIMVTAGGQAAVFASMSALLDPGQSCIVFDPYYATFDQTVRAVAARPIVVETPADQRFQPDISLIEAALAPDTKAILVNSPNNPTGTVYEVARMEALADLCRRRGIWLIADELYGCQVHEGSFTSARDMPGMVDQCLVIGSLSKSHAMTGSRLGWIVGPEAVVAQLGNLGNTTTYGLPGFIQDAGHFALTEGAEIEAGISERYRRRAKLAVEAVGNQPGLRAVPPQGGMYLMLDIRATGLSGIEFADRLLDAERIAVMPGESFGNAAAGHLRVSLTAPDEVLEMALARVAAFARAAMEG